MTDTLYRIYECWNELHFQFHTQSRANIIIVVFDSSTVAEHHIHSAAEKKLNELKIHCSLEKKKHFHRIR